METLFNDSSTVLEALGRDSGRRVRRLGTYGGERGCLRLRIACKNGRGVPIPCAMLPSKALHCVELKIGRRISSYCNNTNVHEAHAKRHPDLHFGLHFQSP